MATVVLTIRSSRISFLEGQALRHNHSSNNSKLLSHPEVARLHSCHSEEPKSKIYLSQLIYSHLHSPQQYLENIRDKIKARGARGIIGLGKVFRIMDDNNSKSLDRNEFRKALRDFKIDVEDEHVNIVFNAFDLNRDGSIDYDEFLRIIRGDLNNGRLQLVKKAFAKLDRDGSGTVDINDIRGLYNGLKHPDVISGKKSED